MRSSVLCLFLLCMSGMASAQSKAGVISADTTIQMNGALRELYFRSLDDGSTQRQEEALQKAETAYQKRLFDDKLRHFVELWSKMTKQINEQNTFDAKLAHKLSNAFHDLEKSNGWPVRDQK